MSSMRTRKLPKRLSSERDCAEKQIAGTIESSKPHDLGEDSSGPSTLQSLLHSLLDRFLRNFRHGVWLCLGRKARPLWCILSGSTLTLALY